MKTNCVFSTAELAQDGPLLVSFFGGADYYRQSAERLIKQIELLKIAAEVHELTLEAGETWVDACLKKVSFIRDRLLQHQRPVFWCDVDSTVVRRAELFTKPASADLTLFLRNFHYLLTFDHYNFSRTFHPGYVIYDYNKKTIKLLDDMHAIAMNSNRDVTDDYVLHEALFKSDAQYSFHVLPPSLIAKGASTQTEETVFLHGDSGNVDDFRAKVRQHGDSRVKETRKTAVLLDVSRELNVAKKFQESVIISKEILARDRNNVQAFTRLIRNLRALGEEQQLEDVLERGKVNKHLISSAYIFDYERNAKFGRFAEAKAVLSRLPGDLPTAARDEIRSLEYKYSFDERASAKGIKNHSRQKMWWWQRPFPGNWGDIIGPYIVEMLTGVPPKFAQQGPRMFSVGSIIGWADKDTTVWGSGAPRRNSAISPDAKFLAVRGPITLSLVQTLGIKKKLALGDPAMLLPQVYTPRSKQGQYKLGLILHHNHDASTLKIADDVRVIDISRIGFQGIEDFIDEVASCEAILSTSLHGLIVAHAYGIRTRWCDLSSEGNSQVPGDRMKFADYFMSVGIQPDRDPIDLGHFDRIDSRLASHCDEAPKKVDVSALLSAAPFKTRPAREWKRRP